jgi:hypothetical protein
MVIHPLGISVLRAYLLTVPEVTGLVGTRIGHEMVQPFPSLRLNEITSNEVVARRLVRMLTQIDCWAARQHEADRLARVVIGALRESANFMVTGAVMGETRDLSTRSEPDTSIQPPQPRAIVMANVVLRPNP